MNSAERKRWALLTALALLLGLFFLLVAPLVVPQHGTAVRRQRLQSGKELIVVLVGSQACGATKIYGFPEAIDSLMPLLEHAAQEKGLQFSFMGVAIDPSASDGLRFLERFHSLDEVVAGRGWLNSGAVHYIWKDFPGPPAVPQVVVVERDIVVGKGGVVVSHEQMITRVIGVKEIMDWAHSKVAIANLVL